MSEVELAQRFIACRARISGDKLRKGQVAQKDWPKVVRACNELEEAPLWFDDSSDLGILDLRAKARRLHAQEQDARRPRPGHRRLPAADALRRPARQPGRAGRPDEPRPEDPRPRARGAGAGDLPALARARAAHPPKPMLSDLRESGQIEQDADVVAFLYREDYYRDPDEEPDGLADVIIAKHRNGPIGTQQAGLPRPLPEVRRLLRPGRGRSSSRPARGRRSSDAAAAGPDF